MEVAQYLVQSHLVEGRSVAELASAQGIHRATIYKYLARYRSGGPAALTPRSRRPKNSPSWIPVEIEEEIVLLRKQLSEDGLDAGAETIHYHLSRRHDQLPSVSSIWRILKRRGFVSPQPKKRPRSSFCRFEAELPNQMWQSDMTHWQLGTGQGVEIVTFIDDCSRLVLGCSALYVTKATNVAELFHQAGTTWGYPASVLTDNGCIYTAEHRGGKVVMESVLEAMGIVYKHGRPYHPQTQGKVERFQQTLKKWLAKQRPASSLAELQSQLEWFCRYYNEIRPHRSLGRRAPKAVFDERVKAKPGDALASTQFRVRHDKVDKTGAITLRYRSKLFHIGMGARHKGKTVTLLIADRDIRVVSKDGELLRHFQLDPTRDYQPQDRLGPS